MSPCFQSLSLIDYQLHLSGWQDCLRRSWLGETKRKSLLFASLIRRLKVLSFTYASKLATLRKTKTLSASAEKAFSFVGVAGFEPATLWSQTRCANRAALHPEKLSKNKTTFCLIIIKTSIFSGYRKVQVYKVTQK